MVSRIIESLAFIKPNYPDETRVAILPKDLLASNLSETLSVFIEEGFGDHLGIPDDEYAKAGATLVSREEAFSTPYIFSLKLIQEDDYPFLDETKLVIGWTHPTGSGKKFWEQECVPRGIGVVDLDSVFPSLYRGATVKTLEFLGSHFFWKNSYIAGQASIKLASEVLPKDKNAKIIVLGSGSVSQGSFQALSALGYEPRMIYRKTMDQLQSEIDSVVVLVNGIENDDSTRPIVSQEALLRMRNDVLIIDAAADAGGAIYGTEYQSLSNPYGFTMGRKYLLVNNAPTVFTSKASEVISEVLTNRVIPNLLLNESELF